MRRGLRLLSICNDDSESPYILDSNADISYYCLDYDQLRGNVLEQIL